MLSLAPRKVQNDGRCIGTAAAAAAAVGGGVFVVANVDVFST